MREQIYAFPGEHVAHLIAEPDGRATPVEVQHPGMTLRDYFAAHVLPAVATQLWVMLGQSKTQLDDSSVPKLAAEFAYEVADAMLAARESQP